MTRILIQIVIPLLFPLMVYIGWLWWSRSHHEKRLGERLEQGPWAWLLMAGAALAAIAMVTYGEMDSGGPAGKYVPAQYKDGEVIPGRFE